MDGKGGRGCSKPTVHPELSRISAETPIKHSLGKKKVKILKYENIPLNNLPMVLKQKEFVFKKKMFFSN